LSASTRQKADVRRRIIRNQPNLLDNSQDDWGFATGVVPGKSGGK
jgi:hypothetical protein